MLTAALQAAVGLSLLLGGAEFLVRGAARLALQVGVSPLGVGLTVVAFGTSAPELAVSLSAGLVGADGIALGNVVGSNICNVALILALSALIRPVAIQAKLIRVDTPLMVGCSLLLLAMMADDRLSRLEGVVLLVGLLAYTWLTLRQARREPDHLRRDLAEATPSAGRPLGFNLALVAGGLLALVAGGNLLVRGAVVLATGLGIGEAAIGLTVVAVGTSLPELATSLVASARGHQDIAIGNVVGSNIFNVLGILGVSAAVQPLARAAVSWIDLGVMVGTAMVLLPLMRSGLRLSRLEGALLIAGYLAYVGWVLGA